MEEEDEAGGGFLAGCRGFRPLVFCSSGLLCPHLLAMVGGYLYPGMYDV